MERNYLHHKVVGAICSRGRWWEDEVVDKNTSGRLKTTEDIVAGVSGKVVAR